MLRLDYTLHEHGWASATVGDGETAVSFEVSYLGDALGDLARATRAILRGLPESKCAFQHEPVILRLDSGTSHRFRRITDLRSLAGADDPRLNQEDRPGPGPVQRMVISPPHPPPVSEGSCAEATPRVSDRR